MTMGSPLPVWARACPRWTPRGAALLLAALIASPGAAQLPPDPEAGAWQTLNPDGTPRVLPAPPAGQAWSQACSCRPPPEGADGALYRQCLCTPASLDPPAADAPLAWIVQRATHTAPPAALVGL